MEQKPAYFVTPGGRRRRTFCTVLLETDTCQLRGAAPRKIQSPCRGYSIAITETLQCVYEFLSDSGNVTDVATHWVRSF